MNNFFKNALSNFTLFDRFDRPVLEIIWSALGSMVLYFFVSAKTGGWESLWVPFAVTFLAIWIFKSVGKTLMKEEFFKYNLILEIALYFVAVVVFRGLYG